MDLRVVFSAFHSISEPLALFVLFLSLFLFFLHFVCISYHGTDWYAQHANHVLVCVCVYEI